MDWGTLLNFIRFSASKIVKYIVFLLTMDVLNEFLQAF